MRSRRLRPLSLASCRDLAEDALMRLARISGEANMEIAAWLEGLGLSQYEQAFRENDIDTGVLPELTAEDLSALGIRSIGHRRKLLAAIAALRAAPISGPPPPTTRLALP